LGQRKWVFGGDAGRSGLLVLVTMREFGGGEMEGAGGWGRGEGSSVGVDRTGRGWDSRLWSDSLEVGRLHG
jgi:hypothetical protein